MQVAGPNVLYMPRPYASRKARRYFADKRDPLVNPCLVMNFFPLGAVADGSHLVGIVCSILYSTSACTHKKITASV